MEERNRESAVGCFLFGGIALAGLGLLLTIFMYLGAVATLLRRQDPSLWAIRGIGPGMIAVGLLSAAAALLYGIWEGRRLTSGKGRVYSDAGAQVVARFAIDGDGEVLTDEWLYDERDDVRFFVKLRHADGRIKEYQCRREVLAMCGEGMHGIATFDGRWLGGFVPQLGGPPAP